MHQPNKKSKSKTKPEKAKPHQAGGACCALGKEKFLASTQKILEKYGWVAFYTPFEDIIDAKTLGLFENFDHPELQIVLKMDYARAHGVLCTVVDHIKEGMTFEAGKDYEGIIPNLKIRFVESTRDDMLRLIFPDPNGSFNNPMYKWQETAFDPSLN